jgi:hypothetical protein
MSIRVRMAVYHKVNLKRMVLNMIQIILHRELIALAAPGMDQADLPGFVNLLPQPLDVDLNKIGKRIIVLIPDMLGNFRP